jgi:hypothetical protein
MIGALPAELPASGSSALPAGAALEPTQASIRALLQRMANRGWDADESGAHVGRAGAGGEPATSTFPRGQAQAQTQSRSTPEDAVGTGAPLPDVAYLLPGLPAEGSGGSHSLVQEARGLRDLGVPARICVPAGSLRTATGLYGEEDELFTTYRSDATSPGVSDASLLDAVGDADVVVATEYPSVELLARLRRERPGIVCAYYVQDYEPLFSEPRSSRSDRALLSYRAIPGQLLFAKSDWLCSLVRELHLLPVAKVVASLDQELFHAGGRSVSEGPLRIAAMIRPRTPRRRPLATLQSLAEIHAALGEDAEILTFGCDAGSFALLEQQAPVSGTHLGLLGRPQVAELMRRSDVFIDASAYQAFGRTGLEAMACGAVPLLPALGGVAEYALDGQNALILADASPEEIAAAIVALARERPRLDQMRRAGVLAARTFSIERAARSQLELFSAALARRQVEHGAETDRDGYEHIPAA